MKTFREYRELQERIVNIPTSDKKALIRVIEEMLKDIQKIEGPLLFKGLQRSRGFALVSSYRKEFSWYGMDRAAKGGYFEESEITKNIIRRLGFKNPPVFCTNAKYATVQFGDTFVVIPRGPYKMFWSPKVKDILYNVIFHKVTDASFKALDDTSADGKMAKILGGMGTIDYDKRAKSKGKSMEDYLFDSYKQVKKAPKRFEILLDTKEYWVIDVDVWLLERATDLAGIDLYWEKMTYADLEKALKALLVHLKRGTFDDEF